MKYHQYKWQGYNHQYTFCQGVIQCSHLEQAYQQLKIDGITVLYIKKKYSLHFERSISEKSITHFTEQLAHLLQTGVAIEPALNMIKKNNAALYFLIDQIINDINKGKSFSSTLNKYPKYFDPLYQQFIMAGEQTGKLPLTLSLLAQYRAQHKKYRSELRSALSYPLMMIVVSISITLFLMLSVIPTFEHIFDQFSGQLPFITQVILKMSRAIKTYGFLVIGVITIIALVLFKILKKNKRYILFIHKKCCSLPLLGALLTSRLTAQWTNILSIQLNAGVPLSEALSAMEKAAFNYLSQDITQKIHHQLLQGKKFSIAIQEYQFFPETLITALSIAEETGTLAETLANLSKFYQDSYQRTIQSFISLCEPTFILLTGLMIGFFVVALYLPIIRLGQII